MKKKYLEAVFIPIIFAVLIVWFFKEALFQGRVFVERDVSRYYYPLRFFAVNCVKSGIFPFWNPYLFCGNPLFASLQSCVLYPLSAIYYFGDFAKSFNIFIAAHFFLAGLFTYIFMRQMRYSLPAAFLSGAAFALSGYMTSVVNLLTTLSTVTWFPLAMLFFYKMIKAAGEKYNAISLRMTYSSSAIILGIIFTMMFLGGEPSVLYMTIMMFFFGSAYFTIEEWVEKKRLNFNYTNGIILAILVFLGLSAFQLLPFAEFIKISSRQNSAFEVASTWNFPLHDMPAIIWPFFHDIYKPFINYWARQSWLDNYYIGVLAFILFVSAVLFDKSKKSRAIFILGLAGLIISLGKDSFVFLFLYKFMPAFKIMRYSIRFFFIPTFSVCVLAGIGLDYYSKSVKSDETFRKFAFFIFILAFLFSIAFLALNFYEPYFSGLAKATAAKIVYNIPAMPKAYAEAALSSEALPKFIEASLLNLKRLFLLTSFFGLLFYLGVKKEVRPAIFITPMLLLLAVSDVFQVNVSYSPLYDIKKFKAASSNMEYLIKETEALKQKYPNDFNKQLFRICCSPQTAKEHAYVPEPVFEQGIEASKDRFITNRSVEFGIYDIGIYESVYNQRNSEFSNILMEKKPGNLEKLLALLNVRFIAGPEELDVTGFKIANKAAAANIYESKYYLPRAFLAENPVVIKNKEEMLERLKTGKFNPAKDVFLEEDIPVGAGLKPAPTQDSLLGTPLKEVSPQKKAVPAGIDSVVITSYTPNKIIIEADVTGKPKFLVLSDTYYPGWKAVVDGKQHRILRADYILRAVYLSAGKHNVKFIYDPLSFKIGLFVTCLTLIILTFIFFHHIIK